MAEQTPEERAHEYLRCYTANYRKEQVAAICDALSHIFPKEKFHIWELPDRVVRTNPVFTLDEKAESEGWEGW